MLIQNQIIYLFFNNFMNLSSFDISEIKSGIESNPDDSVVTQSLPEMVTTAVLESKY